MFVKGLTAVNDLTSAAMAIAMIAAFLLVIGGIRLMRDRTFRARGALMLVAAAVVVANVLILTL